MPSCESGSIGPRRPKWDRPHKGPPSLHPWLVLSQGGRRVRSAVTVGRRETSVERRGGVKSGQYSSVRLLQGVWGMGCGGHSG